MTAKNRQRQEQRRSRDKAKAKALALEGSALPSLLLYSLFSPTLYFSDWTWATMPLFEVFYLDCDEDFSGKSTVLGA
jgi:hypothetical protein